MVDFNKPLELTNKPSEAVNISYIGKYAGKFIVAVMLRSGYINLFLVDHCGRRVHPDMSIINGPMFKNQKQKVTYTKYANIYDNNEVFLYSTAQAAEMSSGEGARKVAYPLTFEVEF